MSKATKMMNEETEIMGEEIMKVPVGSLAVDCTHMTSWVKDYPPGELIGKRATQEGYEAAVDEIIANQLSWGSKVGVSADDIRGIRLADMRIAMIDACLPAARKMVEMLEETRIVVDDERHRRISKVAALVDAQTKTGPQPDLLARYEKTRAYRSQAAMKAVRTRRQNAAAEEPAADSAPVADAPAR